MPPATAQWVPPALPRRLWHAKHSLSPASLRRDGQVFPRQALPAGREAAGRRMLDGDSVSLQSPPAIMLSLRGPSEGVSFLPRKAVVSREDRARSVRGPLGRPCLNAVPWTLRPLKGGKGSGRKAFPLGDLPNALLQPNKSAGSSYSVWLCGVLWDLGQEAFRSLRQVLPAAFSPREKAEPAAMRLRARGASGSFSPARPSGTAKAPLSSLARLRGDRLRPGLFKT